MNKPGANLRIAVSKTKKVIHATSSQLTKSNPAKDDQIVEVPKTPITIVLTFDDGPDNRITNSSDLSDDENATLNHTLHLIRILKKLEIRAAFFIQTGEKGRMADAKGNGRKVVEYVHKKGHAIQIHTGDNDGDGDGKDHADHTVRARQKPYDTDSDKTPDGATGLESDLRAAKIAIASVTKEIPRYVRAPYGHTNSAVMSIYETVDLKHIYWDIDSEDWKHGDNTEKVISTLKSQLLQKGKSRKSLIVLFHDVNKSNAYDKIEIYVDTIKATLEGIHRIPQFTKSREEIYPIFDTKAGRIINR